MTVTRTLRLDDDLEEALLRMSEEEGESVNVLAARSLRRLVEWQRPAEKLGLVTVSPRMLARLMDTQTVDQARELGRWVGKEIWEPYIRYVYRTVTFDIMLQSLDLMSRYSLQFQYDHAVSGGRNVVVLRHSMGIKYSAFYEGALLAVLQGMLKQDMRSSITDELCTIEFQR
ncbi:MAG TPA: hypothetical protein VEJ36_04960 [Nitrososphaerales archaeon]|nr:hypothetical protein [Nitrososphaerales archaeon]